MSKHTQKTLFKPNIFLLQLKKKINNLKRIEETSEVTITLTVS